jgi:hypothetical protein
MAYFYDKNLNGITEVIDGHNYERCTFVGCNLVYRGGPIPKFSGCSLDHCKWTFEDAAQRTIALLKGINSGMGAGGRQLIEETIKDIQTPFPKQPGLERFS